MLRAKYLLPLSVTLLGALAFALSSCGGGGGGEPAAPPLIGAELNSFPAGSVPPGFNTNTTVVVLNSSNGNSIANATVTMNGVPLTYSAADETYVGNVVVAPGGAVTLSVTDGSGTYTVSTTQFTSYPTVSAPATGDTWDSSAANTVIWSGGTPTANAEYVIGILDAADPNGLVQWPESNFVKEIPLGTTSFSIPAVSIPAGNRLMIVGISSLGVPIPNAAPGSFLLVEGFNYVPITVTGFPVTVRTMGAKVFPRNIASSASQFVAVGGSVANLGDPPTSAILTSPDGITWTRRNSSSSEPMVGITWSGTQFVTVGQHGTILTSPDGIAWTTRLAGFTLGGATIDLVGVAWSGSAFVAVGNFGTTLSSPDGVTWTLRAGNISSSHLNAVAWSGTKFVAVGVGGTIVTSPDGANWTTQTSNTSGLLNGVAWSGSQFVAIGGFGGAPGAILTSPDGVTWTSRTYDTSASPVAVTWTGTQFVAVGGFNLGSILTSPDGVIWTRQATGTNALLTGVAWSGTKLVSMGGEGTVLTSP